jgi:hypothetical protein
MLQHKRGQNRSVRQSDRPKARERMIREIQQLQRAGSESTNHVHKSIVFPDIGLPDENTKMYDPTSLLSKELQQHPWPQNYKPRIPRFDGKTNPGNFIASYETTVYSARGDI